MSEKSIETKLVRVDGYKFDVNFDVDYLPNLLVDEPKPIGEGAGPNAPRLLAAAMGQCMSSSLIYCLNKARIPIINLESTVKFSPWIMFVHLQLCLFIKKSVLPI